MKIARQAITAIQTVHTADIAFRVIVMATLQTAIVILAFVRTVTTSLQEIIVKCVLKDITEMQLLELRMIV